MEPSAQLYKQLEWRIRQVKAYRTEWFVNTGGRSHKFLTPLESRGRAIRGRIYPRGTILTLTLYPIIIQIWS